MKTLVSAFFILFSFFQTRAESLSVEQNNQRLEFEQKLSTRLESALATVLGKENFYINIKIVTQKPKENVQPVFFQKLGLTSSLPVNDIKSVLPFDKWVQNVDLEIVVSEKIKQLDQKQLKEKASALLKSIGQFKFTVAVNRFSPTLPNESNWWADIPWTPMAVLLGGLLISFAFLGLNKAVSKLELTVPMSPAFNGFEDIEKNKTEDSFAHVKTEDTAGLLKWKQILSEDFKSARSFFLELANSVQPSDAIVLDYVLKKSPVGGLRALMQDLDENVAKKIYNSSLSQSEDYSALSAETFLQKRLHEHLMNSLVRADQSVNLIHDFSIEECIDSIKTAPDLLNVFVDHFSTLQIERIFAGLEPQILEKMFQGKMSDRSRKELIQVARDLVDARRKKTTQLKESSTLKALLAASHIDAEREQILYKAALVELSEDDILQAAMDNFPKFLIPQLPIELIKTVLLSYAIKERAQLISSLNATEKANYLSLFENEGRGYEVLEAELEEIESSEARIKAVRLEAERMIKDFSNRVRKYISQSSENKSAARALVVKWIASHRKLQNEKSAA